MTNRFINTRSDANGILCQCMISQTCQLQGQFDISGISGISDIYTWAAVFGVIDETF